MARKPSNGNVGSRWGWRTHPVTGEKDTFHYGLDIGWRAGLTLVAPEDGVVTAYGTVGNWGRRLTLRGASGYTHYLGHTKSASVKTGTRVTEGTPIAVMGETGRVTGVHVHWEVHNSAGVPIDPEAWLARMASTGSAPFTPHEEDEMTPEQSAKLDAVYAGLFGPKNLSDEAGPLGWKNFDGDAQESRYGLLPITIHNQTLIARSAGELAALKVAVSQMSAGTGVVLDVAAIEEAAERGARDALAGLVLRADG